MFSNYGSGNKRIVGVIESGHGPVLYTLSVQGMNCKRQLKNYLASESAEMEPEIPGEFPVSVAVFEPTVFTSVPTSPQPPVVHNPKLLRR